MWSDSEYEDESDDDPTYGLTSKRSSKKKRVPTKQRKVSTGSSGHRHTARAEYKVHDSVYMADVSMRFFSFDKAEEYLLANGGSGIVHRSGYYEVANGKNLMKVKDGSSSTVYKFLSKTVAKPSTQPTHQSPPPSNSPQAVAPSAPTPQAVAPSAPTQTAPVQSVNSTSVDYDVLLDSKKTMLDTFKHSSSYLKDMDCHEYPEHWKEYQQANPQLVDSVFLPKGSELYNEIASFIAETMFVTNPDTLGFGYDTNRCASKESGMNPAYYQIESIEMNCNRINFDLYNVLKKSWKARLGGSCKEKWVYHGTKCELVNTLFRGQSYRREWNLGNSQYGKGTYFSEEASYSFHSQYSKIDTKNDPDARRKVLILNRLLVGRTAVGNSSIQSGAQWPIHKPSNEPYDTLVNNLARPAINVAGTDFQAFPEFAIRFRQPPPVPAAAPSPQRALAAPSSQPAPAAPSSLPVQSSSSTTPSMQAHAGPGSPSHPSSAASTQSPAVWEFEDMHTFPDTVYSSHGTGTAYKYDCTMAWESVHDRTAELVRRATQALLVRTEQRAAPLSRLQLEQLHLPSVLGEICGRL